MGMDQDNFVLLKLLSFEMIEDMNSSLWVVGFEAMMNQKFLNIFNWRLIHYYLFY